MKLKERICRNFIAACITSLSLCYYFQISTGNIAGIVFLFGLFYIFMHTEFLKDRRAKICSGVGAAICSVALVFGKIGRSRESILDALERFRENIQKDSNTVQVFLSGYGSAADVAVLCITLAGIWIISYYILLKTLEILNRKNVLYEKQACSILSGKIFLVSFLLLMICWLPYFVINFPGVLTMDSIIQISQAEGTMALNDAHPAIHTALLSGLYHFGKTVFHTSNAGVAIYIFAQMMVLAAIYSKLIVLLKKSGLRKLYVGAVWAYFAFLPLHAVYAVTMWKDILFSGFVLWLSMSVYEIYVCGRNSGLIWFQFIVMGSLTNLFRHNGIIAFVFCIPVFIILLKDRSWKNIIFVILPICIFYLVKGPVYDSFNVQKNNTSIPMTIPIQHIARVAVSCGDKLTEKEKDMIEQIASLEDIKQTYNCRYSDPMAILISNNGTNTVIEEHKWEYFKLWLTLGLKHPVSYVLAEIDATVGYWYPDEQYPVIFKGVNPEAFGITPFLNQQGKTAWYAYAWCNLYRYIPVLGNLFSIGTAFLLMVLCMLKNIYDRQYQRLAVSMPCFMAWLTIMISTPLHSEMRYVYYMMLTIPLIVCVALLPVDFEEDGNEG